MDRKINVTSALRGMEIGNVLEFPIEKYHSVRTCYYMVEKASAGKKKFSSTLDYDKKVITVKREE